MMPAFPQTSVCVNRAARRTTHLPPNLYRPSGRSGRGGGCDHRVTYVAVIAAATPRRTPTPASRLGNPLTELTTSIRQHPGPKAGVFRARGAPCTRGAPSTAARDSREAARTKADNTDSGTGCGNLSVLSTLIGAVRGTSPSRPAGRGRGCRVAAPGRRSPRHRRTDRSGPTRRPEAPSITVSPRWCSEPVDLDLKAREGEASPIIRSIRDGCSNFWLTKSIRCGAADGP